MGYRSPYMRFGNTRYEKNIAKLRRYDLNIREEAYKDAVKTLNEVITEPDSSQNYIDNVAKYADACKRALARGPVLDDDAELVARYALEVLGQDEYDWMKGELAQKGEEVKEYPWLIK